MPRPPAPASTARPPTPCASQPLSVFRGLMEEVVLPPVGHVGDSVCSLCGVELENYWKCPTCGSALCEPCFFEERHAHKMEQRQATLPDRALYQFVDPITQHTVFLGNCVGATPGSQTLKLHDIRFVLTLIDFGEGEADTLRAEVRRLRELYSGGKRTVELAGSQLRYHLIPMPDVLSPERLPAAVKQVLEEATCFLDAALQQGNVLVHCQRGEKRSPTVMLAWMATRGVGITEGIEQLDKGYRGKEGWGEVYKRTRKDWIVELKDWSKKWKERQKKWSETVVALTK
jgi:hypothetical protein